MTIQEIMNLSAIELENLSDADLRKITRQLVDAANHRLKRIEAREQQFTPAYRERAKKKIRFETSRKDERMDLLNKFKEARAFLQSTTSTAKGTRNWVRNVNKAMGREADAKYEAKYLKFMSIISDLYVDLTKRVPQLLTFFTSDQIKEIIRMVIQEKGYTPEEADENRLEIITYIEEKFNAEIQKGREGATPSSDFSTWGTTK